MVEYSFCVVMMLFWQMPEVGGAGCNPVVISFTGAIK